MLCSCCQEGISAGNGASPPAANAPRWECTRLRGWEVKSKAAVKVKLSSFREITGVTGALVQVGSRKGEISSEMFVVWLGKGVLIAKGCRDGNVN